MQRPGGEIAKRCLVASLPAPESGRGRSPAWPLFLLRLLVLPPSLWPSWLSLFCSRSHVLSHFLFPSFLLWALPHYGWLSHLLPVPRARQGRTARGALSPTPLPDTRPRSGLLCLLLGLCEPTCVRVRVSTCLGASVYALCPGSGFCLWSPGLSVLPLVHHGAGQGRLLVRGMDSC